MTSLLSRCALAPAVANAMIAFAALSGVNLNQARHLGCPTLSRRMSSTTAWHDGPPMPRSYQEILGDGHSPETGRIRAGILRDVSLSSAAVGRYVRELRTRAGRSLSELARKSGIAATRLDAIERGRERPSLDALAGIARALHTTLPKLVSGAANSREASARPLEALKTSLDRIGGAVVELPKELGSKLDAVEVAVVRLAMLVCEGNQSAAARLLGLERKALTRRWVKIRPAGRA
jgi:transcriptional regulator with XRE-family HTH domain